jgi:hypothetical protein
VDYKQCTHFVVALADEAGYELILEGDGEQIGDYLDRDVLDTKVVMEADDK